MIRFLLSMIIYLIRPLLGPLEVCPFTVGCTEYALMQLEQQPLGIALKNITQRLLSCNPITNIFKHE